MTAFFHFLLTLLVSFGIAVAILIAAFLLFLLIVWGSKMTEKTKRDLGQVLLGALMLFLGLSFLWSARSALLYHTTIYFKGWIYPWQAIIGGSLAAGFGLFLFIHGLCRKKNATSEG
jgi:hypothetical protein